jgi:hypothetical protein
LRRLLVGSKGREEFVVVTHGGSPSFHAGRAAYGGTVPMESIARRNVAARLIE